MDKFWGKVRTYKKRGRKLGFPTANVDLHNKLTEGVYISETKIKDSWLPSLTFIGAAKTFGDKKYQSETYILGFNQDIYDKWISVKFLKKIRGNKKFNSSEDLVKQMEKDKQQARKYFSENPQETN